MLKRLTIAFKLVSGLLAILLLVIGISAITYVVQRDRIFESIFTELTLINNSSRLVMLDAIDGIKQQAIDFSSDGFIRDATKEIIATGDPTTRNLLGDHLRKNKMALDPAIYGINIADLSGKVIASTDPREVGTEALMYLQKFDPDAFTYGMAYIADFTPSNNFGIAALSLPVVAPLTDKITGAHIGTLLIFVKGESVADALKIKNDLLAGTNRRHAVMELFLINRDGYIIDERYFDGSRLTQQADVANILQCSQQKSYLNTRGANV